MQTGIELIAAERERQVREEGWTPVNDDQHEHGELAAAGAAYAILQWQRDLPPVFPDHASLLEGIFRWPMRWWKPTPSDRVRELVKAGALIAAEIDRLQRAKLWAD